MDFKTRNDDRAFITVPGRGLGAPEGAGSATGLSAAIRRVTARYRTSVSPILKGKDEADLPRKAPEKSI